MWGYDYFGGTRTVDVHVRRLRAKLGPEYEAMIGTVRNVGYKFVRPTETAPSRGRAAGRHWLAAQRLGDANGSTRSEPRRIGLPMCR